MSLVDEAERLLLYQFNKSPKLISLVRSLVRPLEECDQALASLDQGRYISEACGERLDILGRLVKQARQGMSDDEYRAWIKVAIKLKHSSGRPEDILNILKILYDNIPNIIIKEYSPNDVVFIFFSFPKTPIKSLINIIRSACPLTIKCHFVRADT